MIHIDGGRIVNPFKRCCHSSNTDLTARRSWFPRNNLLCSRKFLGYSWKESTRIEVRVIQFLWQDSSYSYRRVHIAKEQPKNIQIREDWGTYEASLELFKYMDCGFGPGITIGEVLNEFSVVVSKSKKSTVGPGQPRMAETLNGDDVSKEGRL